jgi:hypothetical protein
MAIEEQRRRNEVVATPSSLLLPFPSSTPKPRRLKIRRWRLEGCGAIVIPLAGARIPHEVERATVKRFRYGALWAAHARR